MPESKILPFAGTDTGSNLMTDAAYAADSQRPIGHQPGVARSVLINKTLRQTSLMAAALAKFISDVRSMDVTDAMTHEALASQLYNAINNMISGVAPPAGYETTGMIAYFPRTTPPINWVRCNGAAVSRASYANLFSVIGTIFGPGDGSTTFNLPDLRGEFIRSLDDGRGVDPGRGMGTWQKGTMVALDSTATPRAVNNMRGTPALIGGDAYAAGNYVGVSGTYLATSYEYSIAGSPDEFTTARPRNVAMLACIKY